MLSFASPLGFLALLGIPVVLAIHFLQRRSRVETVSTLFLLESLMRESAAGGRVERIRNSLPLWLQLLAVCLLAWLLAGPRWTAKESVARVVLVLDSSASMSAFKEEMVTAVEGQLEKLGRAASRSEYIALDSAQAEERVFQGETLGELVTRLEEWQPALGRHEIGPSLNLARGLAGEDGVVVFVSDHEPESLPDGVRLLAVGRTLANCGFSGLSVGEEAGEELWTALVKNYGDTPQTRKWWLESGDGKTQPREIELAAGASETLRGPLPENQKGLVLVLEKDGFELDDRLPLLRPQKKPLKVWRRLDEAVLPFYRKVFDPFESLSDVGEVSGADLAVLEHDPLDPALPDLPGTVVMVRDASEKAPFLGGAIAVENHPLMDGLNWQGLSARGAGGIKREQGDEVLLWAGERAMVVLRERGSQRGLLINFDPTRSNAARLPAFVVMLHRFVESVRAAKVGEEWLNVETGQGLEFAFERGEGAKDLVVGRDGGSAAVPLGEAATLAAPLRPGHFEIRQGDGVLVRGAAHFADAREADFSEAAASDQLSAAKAALVSRHSRRDPLWRLWALLIGGAVLWSWSAAGGRRLDVA